jgi:hypothetical protein
LARGRLFGDYAVVEVPGDHGVYYETAFRQVLPVHMQKAEGRLPDRLPRSAHRALLSAVGVPDLLIAGETRTISVVIENLSALTWPAAEASNLYLANRWLDEAGNVIIWVCAVTRRRFPVGASPTRQPLQPEAIGAVMEETKWLKPSISVSRIGDSASVQAATRVNAEQASKRTMRRPTRQPFRGRLIRLDGMSETDAQSLRRGSGDSMYTRKAYATREASRRGQG